MIEHLDPSEIRTRGSAAPWVLVRQLTLRFFHAWLVGVLALRAQETGGAATSRYHTKRWVQEIMHSASCVHLGSIVQNALISGRWSLATQSVYWKVCGWSIERW
jgi:hypothetical protein